LGGLAAPLHPLEADEVAAHRGDASGSPPAGQPSPLPFEERTDLHGAPGRPGLAHPQRLLRALHRDLDGAADHLLGLQAPTRASWAWRSSSVRASKRWTSSPSAQNSRTYFIWHLLPIRRTGGPGFRRGVGLVVAQVVDPPQRAPHLGRGVGAEDLDRGAARLGLLDRRVAPAVVV